MHSPFSLRLVSYLLFATLAAVGRPPNAVDVRPYLEIDGRPVQATDVHLTHSSNAITVRFRATREGTYSFGLEIAAPKLAPLTPGMKEYSCASLTQALVLHYPYDWTSRDPRGNILSSRPRLVMPGLKAGGQIYLADTHELFSIKLAPCAEGNVRAFLLAHRFSNDGGDRAKPELHLRAGESGELTVRLYKDVQAVNRDRFGEHEHTMRGNMAGIFFLDYAQGTGAENDGFFGASEKAACCRSLTPEEWSLTAQRLQGVFRYALLRDRLSSSIAPIFHRRGISIYHYEYLGALRRNSSEITPELERKIALRDVNGQLYTAPRPDGVFVLADIRRPEVRAVFVENARAAIRAGFDGVFLDGWPFWADTTGDVGGNAPSAKESLAFARWLLLSETKAAMRAENPKATLGVLTNHYYDSLGVADWGMKEFMYGSWYTGERTGGNDALGHYRPAAGTQIRKDKDNDFEMDEAPYIPGPIAYGSKGFSPIAVRSALNFIRRPSGLYYTDEGQFPAAALEKYLDAIVAVFKPEDLYISDIDPVSCAIRFEGAATMWSPARCTVNFSRAACVVQAADGKAATATVKFTLEPGVRYNISRECSGSRR